MKFDKSGLAFNSHAEKLFSKREWQRALKASLINAGRDWISTALPKRFTKFAITRLGYNAKKMRPEADSKEQRIKRAIAMMRVNGDYAKLVATYCASWGGWDPTAKEGPPADVWRRWANEAFKSGKIKQSVSGEWRTARDKMRREALDQTRIRERVRLYAIDEYLDSGKGAEPIPLYESGELEDAALNKSRPSAKTRGGASELAIRIPRAGRQAKMVLHVLGQSTPEEADRVSNVIEQQMTAFIQGSMGKKGGRKGVKLKATKAQASRIDSTLRKGMTEGQRGRHANRKSAHKSR